jgi:hypothetical protein
VSVRKYKLVFKFKGSHLIRKALGYRSTKVRNFAQNLKINNDSRRPLVVGSGSHSIETTF